MVCPAAFGPPSPPFSPLSFTALLTVSNCHPSYRDRIISDHHIPRKEKKKNQNNSSFKMEQPIDPDGDEWEYEYHETETEVCQ
jgi:hypothetical protein